MTQLRNASRRVRFNCFTSLLSSSALPHLFGYFLRYLLKGRASQLAFDNWEAQDAITRGVCRL
jgi:hypothetical protein